MPVQKSELSASRRAGYFLSYLFLRSLLGGLNLLPYHLRVPAMGRLTSAAAPLVGFSRRVRDNLALVCPGMPESEVRRLCRAVPDNAGRALIEHLSPEGFIARARQSPISGPGLAAFDHARAQNRPTMLMTGHFGNYAAARAALYARGHVVGGLYRRMANPYFNELYVRAFFEIGEPMFEQGRRGMIEMVRSLRQGGIIAIVSDLHAHGGEELSFFGKPAVTSVLNAELALRHDAVMIPIYAIRKANGLDFDVVMHEPIAHSDPLTMSQQINDDLESMVRQHMDQWFWIHRRWKPWYGLGLQEDDGG